MIVEMLSQQPFEVPDESQDENDEDGWKSEEEEDEDSTKRPAIMTKKPTNPVSSHLNPFQIFPTVNLAT
jgi:hypothetical protein